MKISKASIALSAGLALAGIAGGVQAQDFGAYSCSQLWRERNSIYKSAGYCFQTERARSYFGNAGCVTSDASALPLGAGDRATIAAIVRAERLKGCAP